MKFWLCFVGLLPALFVLAIASLVLVLFDGMRRDWLRWHAQMAGREATRTKREGKKDMVPTGLTPAPQPRRCAACGEVVDMPHLRGCVMTLPVETARQHEPLPASAASTGLEVFQDAGEMARRVLDQEMARQQLFDADLLLHCIDDRVAFTDTQRCKLYEVARAGRVELDVIRRMEGRLQRKPDVLLQADAVRAVAWHGWRKGEPA